MIIHDDAGRTYIVDTAILWSDTVNGSTTKLEDALRVNGGFNNLVSFKLDRGATTFGNAASIGGSNLNGVPGTTKPVAENASTVTSFDPDVLPCYADGTMIDTPRGRVAIEDLQIGDEVLTRDGGAQPIIWRGTSPAFSVGSSRGVIIPAGSFGFEHDIIVSQQHCVVMLVDGEERLVKAKFLAEANLNGCRYQEGGISAAA